MQQPSSRSYIALIVTFVSLTIGADTALALSGSTRGPWTMNDPIDIDPHNDNDQLTAPPIDFCQALVTRTDLVAIKPVARPPFLKAFREPGFGTRMRRITNSAKAQVNKPAGAPAQAWNSDETLLLLHRYTPHHQVVLLDGRDYRELGTLDLTIGAYEDIYWSRRQPDILFFVEQAGPDAGTLTEYNVRTQQRNKVRDFSETCEKNGFPSGNGLLAAPSDDDDLFGYRCDIRSDRSLAIAYQRSADQLSTRLTDVNEKSFLMSVPQASRRGELFWLDGKVLDTKLTPLKYQPDMAEKNLNASLGTNAGGQDSLYQAPEKSSPRGCDRDIWKGLGLLVEHDLNAGTCRPILNQTDGYPVLKNPELFASAYDQPNLIAMAGNGYDDFSWYSTRKLPPLLFSEIFIVNTAPDAEQLCRLAHHRSFGAHAERADYPAHLGEPNVTQSPSGTRVLFSTDWYDSGFVDTYVVELPSFARYNLEGQWVDVDNTTVATQFVQNGDSLAFERRFPAGGNGSEIMTVGKGRITHADLALQYSVMADGNRVVNGSCEGNVTDGGLEMTLYCQDSKYGRQSFTVRRQ